MNLTAAARLLSRLPIREYLSPRWTKFRFNHNQHTMHERLTAQAEKGRPIRGIVVKSRRVGVSAYTDGLLFAHAIAHSNTHNRIIAHLDDSVSELFKVPLGLAKGLPKYVGIPDPMVDKIVVPHRDGDSVLSIATAGEAQGGRGAGFYGLHLSEAAAYKSPEAFTSLLSTVPTSPDTILIIESTANGRVGLGQTFYELWNASMRGETEFEPIFLSWTSDPTCQRDEREMAGSPLDDEEKELVKAFKLSKAQLAWRRWTLANKCFGYLNRLHQEYPVTPDEAFVASGNPEFTGEEMKMARASVAPPIFTGRIERVDGSPSFTSDPLGPLRIWAKPIEGHWYYLGADAARGQQEGDFAAVAVVDGTANEVVATFAERISPILLAGICDALGRYYRRAMVIIELTGNLGLWAQKVLRDDHRYPNFYRWKARDDRIDKSKVSVAAGWETNFRSRQLLFTSFRECVREGLLVKDERVVQQMDTAEENSGYIITKGHDDLLFAAMLANIAYRQYPPPRMLQHRKPEDPAVEDPKQLPRLQIEDDHSLSLRRHFREVMGSTRRKGHNPDTLGGLDA